MTFTISVKYDNNTNKFVYPDCTVTQLKHLMDVIETEKLEELNVIREA